MSGPASSPAEEAGERDVSMQGRQGQVHKKGQRNM